MNCTTIAGFSKPISVRRKVDDPSRLKTDSFILFVSNVEYSVTNRDLFEIFHVHGNIVSVNIVHDSQGRSKGFGFIEYERKECADEAKRALNNLPINGKRIVIQDSVHSQKHLLQNSAIAVGPNEIFRNIYVKNLPPDISLEQFRSLFESFGDIKSPFLQRDSSGKCVGYGFIEYTTHDAALAACKEMDNRRVFPGMEPLRCSRFVSKRERGHNPSSSSSSSSPSSGPQSSTSSSSPSSHSPPLTQSPPHSPSPVLNNSPPSPPQQLFHLQHGLSHHHSQMQVPSPSHLPLSHHQYPPPPHQQQTLYQHQRPLINHQPHPMHQMPLHLQQHSLPSTQYFASSSPHFASSNTSTSANPNPMPTANGRDLHHLSHLRGPLLQPGPIGSPASSPLPMGMSPSSPMSLPMSMGMSEMMLQNEMERMSLGSNMNMNLNSNMGLGMNMGMGMGMMREEVTSSRHLLPSSTIYVTGLDHTVDDSTLYYSFQCFGPLVSSFVARSPEGLSQGFGVITFANAEASSRVVEIGTHTLITGKRVFVSYSP